MTKIDEIPVETETTTDPDDDGQSTLHPRLGHRHRPPQPHGFMPHGRRGVG